MNVVRWWGPVKKWGLPIGVRGTICGRLKKCWVFTCSKLFVADRKVEAQNYRQKANDW